MKKQKERNYTMKNQTIRLLKADEIECRVSIVKETGLSLLLYKDARVDQRILDETFGLFGWKRSHQCIDGNLYCTVEIYDRETGAWIAKHALVNKNWTLKLYFWAYNMRILYCCICFPVLHGC